ncbi:MAG: glycoside hydrolase family 9 protein, partial [Cyclobacteriaceae bacterium]|nr:glycoside hydrolase family 9 protein [Cyclobacteriaceae bacterium]
METPIGIRLNQIGFFENGEKLAVVASNHSEEFSVVDLSGKIVYSGKVGQKEFWDKSGEEESVINFSEFTQKGNYYLVSGEIRSHQFEISDNPFNELLKAGIKSYYFNRASTSLESEFAGEYVRDFSHPDTLIFIHETASSEERPAGSTISAPFGWYDAGDYNKYIVNSGISTYTLLLAYEQNQDLFDTLTWNIPESTNEIPDILDEILWNIKWMEAMQDPQDGGVYHKLTTANFESFVFPTEAKNKRYVTAKGTAAALNFCAVMARMSSIIQPYDSNYSGQLLEKAKNAWKWATLHPNLPFKNPAEEINQYPPIK